MSYYPAGTTRWINVEIVLRTMSQPYFNYISTLSQRQMPAGYLLQVQNLNVPSKTLNKEEHLIKIRKHRSTGIPDVSNCK